MDASSIAATREYFANRVKDSVKQKALEKAADKLIGGMVVYRKDDYNYYVESTSEKGVYYAVRVEGSELHCSCPAGLNGRVCYHKAACAIAEKAGLCEDYKDISHLTNKYKGG